jgi:hypothetical protein
MAAGGSAPPYAAIPKPMTPARGIHFLIISFLVCFQMHVLCIPKNRSELRPPDLSAVGRQDG